MFGHIARMSFIVWSTPYPGREADYNRWYDEVHLPDSIANGSFTAMHRYEVASPGYRAGQYLSIAEADYTNEAEAWPSVRPRAQALHAANRIDDLYRVDYATMLPTVYADVSKHPVTSLTTVQNDWRHPGGSPEGWLAGVGVPATDRPRSVQLFTTDPASTKGPGRHLALYESSTSLDETMAVWTGTGAAGTTPVPAYTTLFGVVGAEDPEAPAPAPVWVAHWRHLVTVGR